MCGRLEACGELAARQRFQLKDDIEIGREATPSLADEEPVGWVGNIVVKSLRVEVIGKVVTARGQSASSPPDPQPGPIPV
jgi:hypothetical protein